MVVVVVFGFVVVVFMVVVFVFVVVVVVFIVVVFIVVVFVFVFVVVVDVIVVALMSYLQCQIQEDPHKVSSSVLLLTFSLSFLLSIFQEYTPVGFSDMLCCCYKIQDYLT